MAMCCKSNSTFLIFGVLVEQCRPCRRYRLFFKLLSFYINNQKNINKIVQKQSVKPNRLGLMNMYTSTGWLKKKPLLNNRRKIVLYRTKACQ